MKTLERLKARLLCIHPDNLTVAEKQMLEDIKQLEEEHELIRQHVGTIKASKFCITDYQLESLTSEVLKLV